MKKFLLTTAAVLMMMQTAFADGITVRLNGSEITFDNTLPTIVNGRTLVPLRGVFDAMGYDVTWDSGTKTATLISGYTVIEATTEGLYKIGIEGATEIPTDTPPTIIGGSFMVPVRAVSEASGAEVEWDEVNKVVSITADVKARANTSQDGQEENDKKEEENIEGKMTVDEKEYIGYIKQYTDEIKSFALESCDKALANALSIPIDEDSLKDNTDYTQLNEILANFSAVQAPDAMSEVQECVEQYISIIREIANSDNPVKTAEEKAAEIRTVAEQNFSVKLYNYFKDNEVNWEKVYGDTVLDALKIG